MIRVHGCISHRRVRMASLHVIIVTSLPALARQRFFVLCWVWRSAVLATVPMCIQVVTGLFNECNNFKYFFRLIIITSSRYNLNLFLLNFKSRYSKKKSQDSHFVNTIFVSKSIIFKVCLNSILFLANQCYNNCRQAI